MAQLADLATSWASIWSNHAVLRTLVTFAHIGSLVVGGGAAITADRGMLATLRLDGARRSASLDGLFGAHRVVIISLVVVTISGVMMLAADLDTLLYSRVFWIKMGLVGLLVANGGLLWNAERRARRSDVLAWPRLRVTAFASAALWLLTTLAGAALLNIG